MILSRNRKFPPARQCARGLFLRKIEYFSSRILGAGGSRGLEGKTIDEGCFSRGTGEGSLITRLIVARLDRGEKSGSRIKKYRLDIPGHPLWQFTSKVDRSKENSDSSVEISANLDEETLCEWEKIVESRDVVTFRAIKRQRVKNRGGRGKNKGKTEDRLRRI